MPTDRSSARRPGRVATGRRTARRFARTLAEHALEAVAVETSTSRRSSEFAGSLADGLPIGLPVVDASEGLAPEATYPDRRRTDVSWYVPEYVVSSPDGPLLRCVIAGHDAGSPVWSGTLQYAYAPRPPASVEGATGDDAIRPAPTRVAGATLRIPETDAATGERSVNAYEHATLAEGVVTFELTGEALRQAYQLLARSGFDHGDPDGPTIAFDVRVDAWADLSSERAPARVAGSRSRGRSAREDADRRGSAGDGGWAQPVVSTRLAGDARTPATVAFDVPGADGGYFSAPPVVLAGVETAAEPGPVEPRLEAADAERVAVRLDRPSTDSDRPSRRRRGRRGVRVRDHRERDDEDSSGSTQSRSRRRGRRVRVRDHRDRGDGEDSTGSARSRSRRRSRHRVRVRDHRDRSDKGSAKSGRPSRRRRSRHRARVRDHRDRGDEEDSSGSARSRSRRRGRRRVRVRDHRDRDEEGSTRDRGRPHHRGRARRGRSGTDADSSRGRTRDRRRDRDYTRVRARRGRSGTDADSSRGRTRDRGRDRDHHRGRARRGRRARRRRLGETVGVVAFPAGPLRDVEGRPVGEAILESPPRPADGWQAVPVAGEYSDPVVLAGVVTGADAGPTAVAVRRAGETGFEYALESRRRGVDADPEAVCVAVIESGRHELLDGTLLEAGSVAVDDDWEAVALSADFAAAPVVCSQAQAGETDASTRHRSVRPDGFRLGIRRWDGSEPPASARVGYCAASLGGPRYDPRTFALEQSVPVSRPCVDHRRDYVAVAGTGETVSFGCSPPWEGPLPERRRYERLGDPLPAGATAFRSLTEPDAFLVVPDRYAIGRDPETGSPSVYVAGTASPSDPMSTLVQLDLALVPDLTPYDRAAIRAHLYDHTREIDGAPADPTIRWPTDEFGALRDFAWAGGLDVTGTPVPAGTGLHLVASFSDTAEATLALDRLRQRNSALTGTLEWGLDEETGATSAVVLDLHRTTGDVVDAAVDAAANVVRLESACDRPVTVRRLLLSGPDPTAPVEHGFAEPVVVEPGGEVLLEGILGPDHEWAAPDFTVEEDPEGALRERRIDADRLEVPLTVTANLSGATTAVEALEVDVRFPGIATTRHLELVPEEGSFAGVAAVASFRLPVTHYLSSAERVVEYAATVRVADGPDRSVGWQRHHLGDAATLVLRPEHLGID